MPRKSTLKKRSRRHRGGYYGATGAIAPGAMQWGTGSEMADWAANSQRGQNAIVGSGRRKTKKGKKGKKSRKTRRVKRGGGKYGGVSASFEGDGVAGMANYAGRTSRDNPGVANLGKFNDNGAAPGSGFGSFITTSK